MCFWCAISGGFDGVGVVPRAARPPRAYPACLLRSHAPLSSGTKGAEGVGFAVLRHSCGGRNPEGLVGVRGAKGGNGVSGVYGGWVVRVEWWWTSTSVARPRRPGHTPRACFARTRPFRRGRKGRGFLPAQE